jgi:16S rRNA (uracil1498-N3)-methyltransferase
MIKSLPDKMDLIIQKAVELGVYEIVPVMTKRVVVNFENKKKEAKKLERWQAIAESAAKQSGRGIIPVVKPIQSLNEVLCNMNNMEKGIIPYENAGGILQTRKIMNELSQYSTIGVFIGPEGGFEESEIEQAMAKNIIPVTLGKRILRTETAGFAVLSMMMLALEEE